MRIGIDVGGTKIEGLLLDPQGVELTRRRVETPRDDYDQTLVAVFDLVEEIEREFAVKAQVGIGIPGTLSRATGLVKNANSLWLNGQSLHQDLSRGLGRTVRLANDADCFTLSEATDGAGAGAGSVFGVILGTGVGGGMCWEGKLLTGPNGIVGEWGHNPLPWPQDDERPGPECYCGKRGCLETFLSGPGLQRDFFQGSGKDLSPTNIGAQALKGDQEAEEALQRYEHRLARGLATVINVLDPEVIVLGGGMSNLERVYEHVPMLWGTWVFSDRVDTRLVGAVHGDSSGVRGAAWLWPPSLSE
ncbi:MAG: ROK family protein [Nitrospirales bacterium]|jgi:fructokinase